MWFAQKGGTMQIPLPEWRNPKYLVAAILALVGFLLLVTAASGTLTIAGWSHDFDLSTAGRWIAFLAGVVLFIGTLIVLFRDYEATPNDDVTIGQPAIAHFLFHSARSAPLWLGIRIYMGVEWVNASYHKLDNPAWRDGSALKGYWVNAASIPEQGRPAVSYELWRDYLNYMINHEWYTWFNWVIMIGELLIGIGLILGALTAVAAFFGSIMNVSFMLSGSASTNPVMFTLAIGIIMAWRTAGLLGLDRIILPLLGTPWQRRVEIGGHPATTGPPSIEPFRAPGS
jgi:thiosulfate dehydrogenase [quinone] large subunit